MSSDALSTAPPEYLPRHCPTIIQLPALDQHYRAAELVPELRSLLDEYRIYGIVRTVELIQAHDAHSHRYRIDERAYEVAREHASVDDREGLPCDHPVRLHDYRGN